MRIDVRKPGDHGAPASPRNLWGANDATQVSQRDYDSFTGPLLPRQSGGYGYGYGGPSPSNVDGIAIGVTIAGVVVIVSILVGVGFYRGWCCFKGRGPHRIRKQERERNKRPYGAAQQTPEHQVLMDTLPSKPNNLTTTVPIQHPPQQAQPSHLPHTFNASKPPPSAPPSYVSYNQPQPAGYPNIAPSYHTQYTGYTDTSNPYQTHWPHGGQPPQQYAPPPPASSVFSAPPIMQSPAPGQHTENPFNAPQMQTQYPAVQQHQASGGYSHIGPFRPPEQDIDDDMDLSSPTDTVQPDDSASNLHVAPPTPRPAHAHGGYAPPSRRPVARPPPPPSSFAPSSVDPVETYSYINPQGARGAYQR